MVFAHTSCFSNVVSAFVERSEYVDVSPTAYVAVEVVPFICPFPGGWKVSGRRVLAVFGDDRRLRHVRAHAVVLEVRAHQVAVPLPGVLGIRRRMNAHEATATFHKPFERCFLVGGQHVSGSAVKHYHLETREVIVVEKRPVLRGHYVPALCFADLLELFRAHFDGLCMPEPIGFCEHQNPFRTNFSRVRRAHRIKNRVLPRQFAREVERIYFEGRKG